MTTAAHGNPGRTVLIGIGNRDRGDDAVGPVVCDLIGDDVRAQRLPAVEVAVFEGSVLDLSTRWEANDRVVIVDAAAPTGRPGHVSRTDGLADRLMAPTAVSTHTIDVGAAIELARALDRLPAELSIVGIEGETFDFGAPLSTEVQRAAGRVVADLRRRWRGGAQPARTVAS